MYSLSQSIRAKGDAGEPLPPAYKALDRAGVKLLRGQLALIAAAGGTGKSAFILNCILNAPSPIPAVYFSADSDAFIQLSRAIAITAKISVEDAMSAVKYNQIDKYIPGLNHHPVRFNYNASPTQSDIEKSLESYLELYNCYPHLIVVDNVTNVRGGSDGDDPFSGLEGLMDWMSDMARQTGACVVGLHHVTGPYNDASTPVPLSGIKGQITRVPALVLTLYRPEPGALGVVPVKNRAGRADPSASNPIQLGWNGDMMSVTDSPFSTTSY